MEGKRLFNRNCSHVWKYLKLGWSLQPLEATFCIQVDFMQSAKSRDQSLTISMPWWPLLSISETHVWFTIFCNQYWKNFLTRWFFCERHKNSDCPSNCFTLISRISARGAYISNIGEDGMLLFEGRRLILGLADTRGPYMNGRLTNSGLQGMLFFLKSEN